MNARRRINLDRLSDRILVYLHQRFFDDDVTYVRFHEIRTAFKQQPANAIRLELDALIDSDLVDQKTERRFRPTNYSNLLGTTPTTPTYWEPTDGYKLSKKGVDRVEKFEDEYFNTLASEVANTPVTHLSPSSGADEIEWEPLPLDRSDQNAVEAIAKAEKALEAIEGDNGFAATQPDVRNGLIETIRGTLKALKNGFPSKRSIVEGLVSPLKFAAKRFGEGAVGAAANAAVKAICIWLGIPH